MVFLGDTAMEFIKNAKTAYIAVSVVMIILGLLLVLFPALSALTLCYIVGAVVTIFGAVKLLSYFSRDLFRLAFQFDFALGIFAVLAGILILLHPTNVVNVMPVIIGVFVLLDGSFKIQTARDAKIFGLHGWWGILVLAILTCLGGLFLIINPFSGAVALMILLGATLIMDGIQNLCVVAYTVKASSPEIDYVDED